MNEPEWMEQAACRGTDVDFIPPAAADHSAALAICAQCPVQIECWAYGVATRSTGVWGGVYIPAPGEKAA